MRNFIALALILSFSSCALIFNGTTTTTNIHTTPEHAQIILNKKDTLNCNNCLAVVKRSGNPLIIKVKKDSLEKTVFVKPILSSTYLLPNILNVWFYGGGYLVDLASPKRFNYPKDIFIDMNKKDNSYSTFNKSEAENQLINLVIHVPTLNTYFFSIPNQIIPNLPNMYSSGTHIDTIGGAQGMAGLLGFSGGIEYYLDKNYYLSGNLGYYPKFGLLLYSGCSRDYRYMSLSINRRINRFHIGAGLAWLKYYYSNDIDAENSDPYGEFSAHGYALRLEAQYQLSDKWYLATYIQPLLAKDKGSSSSNNFTFWGVEFNYKIPVATKNSTVASSY